MTGGLFLFMLDHPVVVVGFVATLGCMALTVTWFAASMFVDVFDRPDPAAQNVGSPVLGGARRSAEECADASIAEKAPNARTFDLT